MTPHIGLIAAAQRLRDAADTLPPDDAAIVREALDGLLAAPPTAFLAATRTLVGLSQKALAEKVGMTQSQLSRIEKHPERCRGPPTGPD